MNIEIRSYEKKDFISLNKLLKSVYNFEKFENSFINKELVAIYNNEIVGYLVINELYDSVLNIKYAYLNYVCVLEKYRRCGIATKLLDKAFEICKDNNISYIELTSQDIRKEAHILYKNNGFKIRDTNVFRKELL